MFTLNVNVVAALYMERNNLMYCISFQMCVHKHLLAKTALNMEFKLHYMQIRQCVIHSACCRFCFLVCGGCQLSRQSFSVAQATCVHTAKKMWSHADRTTSGCDIGSQMHPQCVLWLFTPVVRAVHLCDRITQNTC